MRLRSSRCIRLGVPFGRAAAALVVLGVLTTPASPQNDAKSKPATTSAATAKNDPTKSAPVKLGLHINDPRAFQGYTLLAPWDSPNTYLLDMQGKVVQTWPSDCTPALFPMMLDNGNLLRPGHIGNDSRVFGSHPGIGGRIQEITWDGKLAWDFRFYNSKQLPHHDMTRLPNGNVLLIVSDRKTAEEAIAAGRRPESVRNSYLIPDSLVEIKPTGPTTGKVVWEWHLWDHLIQDHDKTKANYGKVAEHPELVDLNFTGERADPPAAAKTTLDKLRAAANAAVNTAVKAVVPQLARVNPDWTHFNGVAYNPELDQIAVSSWNFSEFWIIDHSTTTAEAASHKGGRCGKGGDLLYRWGNPRAYRAGTEKDQTLFRQHNAHWIPKGFPGAGNLLVFNNGSGRPGNVAYSSVEEFTLPADAAGAYACKPGTAYEPIKPVWSYTAPKKQEFFSSFISGAQRLPNGNTLICSGANGTIFEVTPGKDVVWKYINPSKGGRVPGPAAPPGQVLSPIAGELLGISPTQRMQLDALQKDIAARLDKLLTAEQNKGISERGNDPTPFARPGQVMPLPQQTRLKLTDDQKKDLASLQKVVDEQFDKVLTLAQRQQLKSAFPTLGPRPAIRPAATNPDHPGKIFSAAQQDRLKLSPEQKKRLEEMQKEIDARLATLLTDDQQQQLQVMQRALPPVAMAARPGGGPPRGAPIFRAYRYPLNHPAFAGRKWPAGKTVEELQAAESGKKEAQPKK